MKRCFIAATAALTLAGCITVGTKVNPNVVASFQPGVTTLVEVERQLGEPNQTSQMPDGGTLLVYNFASAHASASSFIPIAGAFVGHTDSKNQMTELFFDRDGKYQKSWATSGQTSAGMINHQ